jgi:hypothetical protein
VIGAIEYIEGIRFLEQEEAVACIQHLLYNFVDKHDSTPFAVSRDVGYDDGTIGLQIVTPLNSLTHHILGPHLFHV